MNPGDYRRAQERRRKCKRDRELCEPFVERRPRFRNRIPSITPRPERPAPPTGRSFFVPQIPLKAQVWCFPYKRPIAVCGEGRATVQERGIGYLNKKGGRCVPPLLSWSPEPLSSRGWMRPPREANTLFCKLIVHAICQQESQFWTASRSMNRKDLRGRMHGERPYHCGGPYRIPHTHRVSTPFFGRASSLRVRVSA